MRMVVFKTYYEHIFYWVVLVKRIFKIIGLLSFFLFGFFYTDKVLEVIREEDSLMIQLKDVKDRFEVDAVNAILDKDTIIPGKNGRSINLLKSYKNMKKSGIYQESEIIYDVKSPSVSLNDYKDKYVILGNQYSKSVGFIFILNEDSERYFNSISRIAIKNQVVINVFVDYEYLIQNSTKIKKYDSFEFYNYGDMGIYSPDNLLFSNNLISRISHHHANLCMVLEKNITTLDLCSKNDLYTIIPDIIGMKDIYSKVKQNLRSGSMIVFFYHQNIENEFNTIVDYVRGKGYDIVGLSELISES